MMMKPITCFLSESALHYPDHPVVRDQGRSYSYRKLEEQSNQLARALIHLGVGKGDRVGIYLNKSFFSVVAVFGIMKAEAAYVPFDPGAPLARLAYIAKNCEVKVLVTSALKAPGVDQLQFHGAPIQRLIILDGEAAGSEGASGRVWGKADWTRESSHSLGHEPAVDSLAYLLYTSGSTGRPKGVAIEHRNLHHFMLWSEQQLKLSPRDRVTSHAPLHFDLSTFDLYATIKAGGTIIIVPETLALFPVQWVKLLQDESVTVIYVVPTTLSLIISKGDLPENDLPHLRKVLFAGEVFPKKYLKQLAALLPRVECYNLYGPTETNVCTVYQVTPDDLARDNHESLPIGTACGPTKLTIVGEGGTPIGEPGVEGELFVQGSCVARCYWGDEEKTKQKFIYSSGEDSTFRTGDRVCYGPDGKNLLFKGRRDHQIKSRGYRIELGEIESTLASHPGVEQSVVVTIPDDVIGHSLHGFVTLTSSHHLSPADLKGYCAKKLPAYMVPETLQIVAQLPLTSTGKMDRMALQEKLMGKD
jgi:amino acid adenylation domain-containing protein